jgi:DNA adenine methylase
MPVTDSPLRYPGGKSQLTPFVVELLRTNELFDCTYVEPFAGGAGIAWTLLLSGYVSEVWINDFDPAIFAFWHAVLNETDALCERIERMPVNIEEWHRQRAVQAQSAPSLLDLGYSTFFLNRTNRSGILKGGVIGGLRQDGNYLVDCRFNKRDLIAKIRRIALYRDQVTLTRLDAEQFIRRKFKSLSAHALVNVDPPYYRRGPELYCSFYKHDDHATLAAAVRGIKQPWMLTYDDTPEIRAMYGGLPAHSKELLYSAQVKRAAVELLVLSPALQWPTQPEQRVRRTASLKAAEPAGLFAASEQVVI